MHLESRMRKLASTAFCVLICFSGHTYAITHNIVLSERLVTREFAEIEPVPRRAFRDRANRVGKLSLSIIALEVPFLDLYICVWASLLNSRDDPVCSLRRNWKEFSQVVAPARDWSAKFLEITEKFQTALEILCRIFVAYVEDPGVEHDLEVSEEKVTFRNLRLKKNALDEFNLPVSIVKGHIARISLTTSSKSSIDNPVDILIEGVSIHFVPIPSSTSQEREDVHRRLQAIKAEKLRISEIFCKKLWREQSSGVIVSLVTTFLCAMKITVKNLHFSYEDDTSCPGRPFTAGVAFDKIIVQSTDQNWVPLPSQERAHCTPSIYKLVIIDSFSVYLDDSVSLSGEHQVILHPTSGEVKITLNKEMVPPKPDIDIRLLFDSVNMALTDQQYPCIVALLDTYYLYLRHYQNRRFRPMHGQQDKPHPAFLLQYAGQTVLNKIHERQKPHTFSNIERVGKRRRSYIKLFRRRVLGQEASDDAQALETLEFGLSFEDIQLYRFLTRRQLWNEANLEKFELERRTRNQPNFRDDTEPALTLNNLQNELNGPSGSEDKCVGPVVNEFDSLQGTLQLRIIAELRRVSFIIRSRPEANTTDIVTLDFERLATEIVQDQQNLSGTLTLGGFGVLDGTVPNSIYSRIIHVKAQRLGLSAENTSDQDSCLQFKFENKTTEEGACTTLAVHAGSIEIVYHRKYVEALYRVFSLRASTINVRPLTVLLNIAFGFDIFDAPTKTLNLAMELESLLIHLPEDITSNVTNHLILHGTHLTVKSADSVPEDRKRHTDSDFDIPQFDSLVYDRFVLNIARVQILLGSDLESCLRALDSTGPPKPLHIIQPVDVELSVHFSASQRYSPPPYSNNFPRFRFSGKTPLLLVNLSDIKYKTIVRIVEGAIPRLREDKASRADVISLPDAFFIPETNPSHLADFVTEMGTPEPIDYKDDDSEIKQKKILEIDYEVDAIRASLAKCTQQGIEEPLGVLGIEHFRLVFTVEHLKIIIKTAFRSLGMEFSQPDTAPMSLLPTDGDDSPSKRDLATITSILVQPGHPDFISKHECHDRDIHVSLSTSVLHGPMEPVLSLWNFLMATLAPENSKEQSSEFHEDEVVEGDVRITPHAPSTRARVALNLAKVQVLLDLDPEQRGNYREEFFVTEA
ncbi:hypothetical protein K439DRAFT_1658746 [Ramaria rubella]|nr:hypothetical protein K439DRAFT_1658746 [Ramaria rubella]